MPAVRVTAMQALPHRVTAPMLDPAALAPQPDLGPGAAESDAFLSELAVQQLALSSHSSEFVELATVDVAGGSLADSDWYRTNWVDVAVRDADAANACFTESGLKRTSWQRCRMTGISLSGCTLTDLGLEQCQLGMANLRFANLARVEFTGCDLSGADFSSARLADVTFTDCVLDGARFADAHCNRVVVNGGSMVGIGNIDGLRGAHIHMDNLQDLAAEMANALGLVLVTG